MRQVKKFLTILSISLLLLTAVNAVIAGCLFMIDPSGGKIGMSVAYLQHSPFTSFLVPGIVLLSVNGILNFIAAWATFKTKTYAPAFIMMQGVLLGGWIVIQVLMVQQVQLLHIIMFLVGFTLLVCGFILRKMNSKTAAAC